MSEIPAVSIIIPTFNQAGLLEAALASVVAQTFPNWEAQIVDNQSTDNTQSIIESFNDPRFIYSRIKNNGIIAASRNQGIRDARGQWIAFLDSDDLWMPEKISLSLLEANQNVDLICHRENTICENRVLRTSRLYDDSWPNYRNLLLRGNCFSPSAVMVRRQSLLQVNGFSEKPEFSTCEDYDLWLRLAAKGVRCRFIEPILSQYRLHAANATSAVDRHMKAGLAVIDHHFATFKPKSVFFKIYYARRRAETIYGAGREFDIKCNSIKARQHYLCAIREFPFLARSYARFFMSILPHCASIAQIGNTRIKKP